MNQLSEHDQLVNAKLEKMKADDWQEVRAMDANQLDAFMDELNSTGRLYDWQHPFVLLRNEAVKAIKDVRVERDRAASDRWFKLQNREQGIAGAAQRVREAIELIEGASTIPDYSTRPPAPPSLDVSTATDDELYATLTECLQIVRAEKDHYADDAQAIALLKTPSSKAIAAELKARAQAYDERRAKADELAQAITAERERRAAEREAAEAARTPQALEERLAQLEAKLTEMGGSAMTKELQHEFFSMLDDIAAQKHQQVDERQRAIDREAEAVAFLGSLLGIADGNDGNSDDVAAEPDRRIAELEARIAQLESMVNP